MRTCHVSLVSFTAKCLRVIARSQKLFRSRTASATHSFGSMIVVGLAAFTS